MNAQIRKLILLYIGICTFIPVMGEGLKTFKLKNGVSVYVWEDNTKPDVFGMVSFKTGATNDPEDLTGLAHYLEHVMFKGTSKIGSLDWTKESVIYEKIITKYDEMAAEVDPIKRDEIGQEINALSIEAAQYSVGNEFSSLVDIMGGKKLNAGTNYDYTVYFNSFPSTQIEKWIDLYSERLINPIFRTFQSELETVYEEYNMYRDNRQSNLNEFMMAHFFTGHPYARSIIGRPEHLKKPQLSKLIEFYNTWYTPSNMALILVGNVNVNEIQTLIESKFGRLEAKPDAPRKEYPKNDYKGRKEVSVKMFYYPMLVLSFNGVPQGHNDEIALNICASLLSNSQRTGFLDKLTIDGDLLGVGCSLNSLKEQGKIVINAIPSFDPNQRCWGTHKAVEKLITKEIENLRLGNIPAWLIESIKMDLIRKFDLGMESNDYKAHLLSYAFVCDTDLNTLLAYKEKVMSLTMDEINAAAKKYFTSDCLVLRIEQGTPAKSEKIEKPKYKAITSTVGQKSDYAKSLEQIVVKAPKFNFCDFNKIEQKAINDRSRLFYNKNTENDVFTLTLKYGVGTAKMPKLGYAIELMKNAGIIAMFKPHEFKQEMSKVNATCNYYVDDNYLYVQMQGDEKQLKEACILLTRQVLAPQLESKQLQSLIGSTFESRRMEKERVESQESALKDFMLHQNNSDYINRLKTSNITALTIGELTGEFQRATNYEAEIHYVGSLPFDEVYDIMSSSLPLKAGETPTTSPDVKNRSIYNGSTVYFLPNNDVTQSKIYFYVEGVPFDKKDDLIYQAFSLYFGTGFGSLVVEEIREKRSMAYTSYGMFQTPPVANKQSHFVGFVGTQGDKTLEVLDIYMGLLQNMPSRPERFVNVKQNIKESILLNKPNFRIESQIYESWKRMGYTEDPAISKVIDIEKMTFDDIQNFYNANIKGKPIVIGIIGNPKLFDVAKLEKYGKVVKLKTSKLFSE